MLKDAVSVREVIDVLNEMLRADPEATNNLVSQRVKCNEALAKHPTVQVLLNDETEYEVGLLGILNGLFGISDSGYGAIMAEIDRDTKRVVKFGEVPRVLL